MRLVPRSAGAALVALALVAGTANAVSFCDGSAVVVEAGAAGHNVAYLVVDCFLGPPCGMLFSVWGYLETNGETGVQRGGITLLGDADICQDREDHDQGIF